MPKGAVGDRGDKHDGDGERIAIEIIDDNSNDIEVEKDGEVRENAGHLVVGAPPGIEGGDSVDENVVNNGKNMDEEKGAETGKEDNESIDIEDVMDNGKKTKAMAKKVPSTIGVGLSTRFVVHRTIITTKAFAIG